MNKYLLIGFAILALTGCGDKVIDNSQAQFRNDNVYEVNQKEPFTGIVVLKYPNGTVKEHKTVKNGKLTSLKMYYSNGQLKVDMPYKDNKANGLLKEYYDNGQLKSEGKFKNGEEDGLHTWYSRNGEVTKREKYKNGRII